jgi:hypothetical protein
VYIIDIFIESDGDNSLDSRNYESIHEVFCCNFAHFVNKTFKIFEAVLAMLDFVHNSDDSSLEGIVAFAVWDGNDLSLVQFSIGLSDLAVGGETKFHDLAVDFLEGRLGVGVGVGTEFLA